jgi:HK97 family phage prohead protease
MDRSGESIPFESWDLSNFQKSPRLLVDHDYSVAAIVGKCTNLEKNAATRAITFEPVFHDITQVAKDTRALVEQGFLDTVSVGFMRKTDEKGNVTNELMEISFVAVPANPSARVLSVKAIAPGDEKAIKEFVEKQDDGEQDPGDGGEAEPQEGDACTMEDGTEGVMQMDENGNLSCMLKKATEQAQAPAEGEEAKGVTEDILEAREELWEAKCWYLDQMWRAFCQFSDAYCGAEVSLDAIKTLAGELTTKITEIAAQAPAPVPMEAEAMVEGISKSMEKMGIRLILAKQDEMDAKAGRVLSEKNRNIIKTARESMQTGIAALDDLLAATEQVEGDEAKAQAGAKTKKGRKVQTPTQGDALETAAAMRRAMQAVNTALSDALREARERLTK